MVDLDMVSIDMVAIDMVTKDKMRVILSSGALEFVFSAFYSIFLRK